MNFNKNLGQADRLFRAGLGLLAVYAGIFKAPIIGDPLLAALIAAFGAVNVVSAGIAWCVVYQLAGISTRKVSVE